MVHLLILLSCKLTALVQFNGIFQENHPDLSKKTAGCPIFDMPVQQADFT